MYRVGEHLSDDFDPQFLPDEAPAKEPTPAPEPAPAEADKSQQPQVRDAPTPEPQAQDQHAIASDQAPPPPKKLEVGEHISEDFDPQFLEEAPQPKKGFGGSLVAGFRSGVGTTPESFAGVADLVQDFGGGAPTDSNAVSDWLRSMQEKVSGGDKTLTAGGVGDLTTSWESAKNYLGESIGQAFGSTVAPILASLGGGTIATALTSETGPGAIAAGAVGATAGGLSYNLIQGWGQMRQGLADDPAIKQALADGKMNRQQLIVPSIVGGTVMGAMEQIGTEAIMASAGLAAPEAAALKTALQQQAVKTVAKMVASGALTEGSTEALQQIAQEVTTVVAGGNVDLQQRLMNVVNNGVAGLIGGGAMHLAGGVKHAAQVKMEPGAAETAPPAGEAAPPATPNAGGGTSTPSNLGGSNTAPPPAQAAPEHTEQAPTSTTPTPAAAPAAAKTTTPVVTPAGTPDPAAASTMNPQPVVNPKTVDVSEDPNYVEPSTPEAEEIYDETEETERPQAAPAAPTLAPQPPAAAPRGPEPTANVAGAGTDTTAALSATGKTGAPVTAKDIADQIIAAQATRVPPPVAAAQQQQVQTPQEQVQAAAAAPTIAPQPAAQAAIQPTVAEQQNQVSATQEPGAVPEAAAVPETAAQPTTSTSAEPTRETVSLAEPRGVTQPETRTMQTEATISREGAEPTKVAAEFQVGEKKRRGKAVTSKVVEPETESTRVAPKAMALKEKARAKAAQQAQIKEGSNIQVTGGGEDTGPEHTPISRVLADIAESDPALTHLSTDPRFSDVVDRAARDTAQFADVGKRDKRGKLKSPTEHIEDLKDQLRNTVKARFEDIAEADRQAAREQARKEAGQHVVAQQIAAARRVEGTGQERARTRVETKEAPAIAKEEDYTTARRLRKRDASSLTKDEKLWLKAYNKRAALAKGSGGAVVRARKPFSKAMEKIRARWVSAQEKVDVTKAAKVQKKAAAVDEVQEAKREAEERGEELSPEQIEAITQEAAAKAAEPAIKERRDKGQAAAKGVLDEISNAHAALAEASKATDPNTAFLGRGKVIALIKRVQAAFNREKLGPLPSVVDAVKYSPEENLVIYARRILAGREQAASVEDVAMGKHIVDMINAGEATPADLYSMMKALKPEEYKELKDFHGSGAETVRRKPTRKMEMADEANETAATTDAPNVSGDHFSWVDDDGKQQSIPVQQRVSGEEALQRASKVNPAWRSWGPMKLFRRMHIKRLRQMVGDTPVLFVSGEHMQQAAGGRTPFGMYLSPHTADIAMGDKPVVLIDADKFKARSKEDQAHLIEHELTHAATAFAIRHNYRGAREIASKMFDALHTQLSEAGIDASSIYGMKDIDEMIAEAHSSENFQKLLSGMTMPREIVERIGLPSDRAPTWWQGLVALTRRALGMDLAPRGTMSYLEGVMAMNPDMMMSTAEQQSRAQNDFADNFPLHGDYYGRNGQESESKYTDFGDDFSFSAMHQHAYNDGLAKAAERAKSSIGEHLVNIKNRFFKTTDQLVRDAADIVGTMQNHISSYGDLLLSRDQKVAALRARGDNLAAKLSEAFGKDMTGTQAVVESINNSNETGTDPSKSLAQNIIDRNVSKAGVRDRAKRRAHRIARAEYMALSSEQKGLWHDIANFFKDQEDSRRQALVENILEGAINSNHVTLPAGMSEAEVHNFVLSGDIDKPAANMTPREQQIMSVLGSTGEVLKKNSHIRKIKGVYVPMTRQGKHVFSARERLTTPAGATLLPETNTEQVFGFRSKKDMENYIDTTDHKITAIRPVTVDQTTGATHDAAGQKLTLNDPNTTTEFRVHAQDKSVHMSDNVAELEQLRQHLESIGHDTKSVNLLSNEMNNQSTLLPLQVQQLLNSVSQSNKSDSAKAAAKAGIVDAYIRTMNGSKAQHRGLKRLGIAGYSRDMVNTILSTNRSMANHLANLHFMPKFAKVEEDIKNMFSTMSAAKSNKVLPLQQIVAEMNDRRDAAYKNNGRTGGFKRLMDAALSASFMTHLASVSFSVFNSTQLAAVTAPVLASEHGIGATMQEMMTAAKNFSVLKTIGKGITETARELGDLALKTPSLMLHNASMPRSDVYSHYQAAVDNITNKPNITNRGAILKALEKLRAVGGATDSGLDAADMSEFGKTRVEKLLHRSARSSRMLSDAVEANNRYVTLAAAVNLAIRKGMTEDQAVDYAVSKVAQTQGIYSGVNNPSVMSHPIGRVITQFKKYPLMIAQLFYGNFAKAIGLNRNAPGQKLAAAKQLAYLSIMGATLAGTLGSPFMEMARMANIFAQMFGGDDWDKRKSDMELAAQRFFNYIGLGSYSEKTAEVLMHGLSRAFGIDVQNRLGNDNLFIFGDPKSVSPNDMTLWGAQQVMGAPGQMAIDTYKAWQDGDPSKLPMPKVIKDFIKSYNAANYGRKSKTGAKVYEKPAGWTPGNILQAVTGISPSAPQRQYEAGGSFIKHKEKTAAKGERTAAVQAWLNSDNPDAEWEKIQSGYNAGKYGKERISLGDLYKAKRRRATDAKKQAKEEAQ